MNRIALLTAALFAVTAVAADKPDEKAAMEAYMKHAMPGPHHKALEPFVGNWTYTAKFWMSPDAPPMEMKGETKYSWILDGRFLREEVTGPAQGGMPPFHGIGVIGYDNGQKKYVATWIDSMTTSITHMSGEMDAAGKTMTFNYREYDAMIGKMVKAKQVTKINGPNEHEVVFYRVGDDGKETKVGEIKATREK